MNSTEAKLKFIQMYLYFVSQHKDGIPLAKLSSLLYLADFSSYYENLEPISGVRYIRRASGPVADIFYEVTNELRNKGVIDIVPADTAGF